jgi:hypothetical protein
VRFILFFFFFPFLLLFFLISQTDFSLMVVVRLSVGRMLVRLFFSHLCADGDYGGSDDDDDGCHNTGNSQGQWDVCVRYYRLKIIPGILTLLKRRFFWGVARHHDCARSRRLRHGL